MDALKKLRLMSDYAEMEQDGMPPMTICEPNGTVHNRMDPDQVAKTSGWKVFPAQMGGGKTIPLLKTMLTSACENDCNYCVFRRQRNYQRLAFSPDERHAYVINELNSTIQCYQHDPKMGELKGFQTISTLSLKLPRQDFSI